MGFFIINGLGFNCQNERESCPNSSLSCKKCLINRLKNLGFEPTSDLKIFRVVSDEKRVEIEKESIWQKFLDVLNIKHVIIMEKETGLVLLNYPVSASSIDVDLLSGFIQANITFSESNKVSGNNNTSEKTPFYEFQYKDFNILLRDGDYVRACIILDHKASMYMRNNMEQFIASFEGEFEEKFQSLRETGLFDNNGMNDHVIANFNIDLVFPMTLAHAIPPEVLEQINENTIQKAIYDIALELLSRKSFFYINNLLNRVKKIVKIDPNTLLFEIYRLYEKKVIISKPIENILNDMEDKNQKIQIRKDKIRPISAMLVSEDDISELRCQMEFLDENEQKELLKSLIKKGKIAERSLDYLDAQKEYEKAQILSREFSCTEENKKSASKLFNLEKKQHNIELEFAVETAELAEKNKDFIKAIYHYQKALKIMEKNVIYSEPDPRIKKIKRKIFKMREII
jgi:hypothetical protein